MAQIDKNQVLGIDNPIRATFFERNKADIGTMLSVKQRILDLQKFRKEKYYQPVESKGLTDFIEKNRNKAFWKDINLIISGAWNCTKFGYGNAYRG